MFKRKTSALKTSVMFCCCLIINGSFISDKALAADLLQACNLYEQNHSGRALINTDNISDLELALQQANLDWITANEALQVSSSYLDDLHTELDAQQSEYNTLLEKLNTAIDSLDLANANLTFAQHKMWSLIKEIKKAQDNETLNGGRAKSARNTKNEYEPYYEEAKQAASYARASLNLAQKAVDKKYKKLKDKSSELSNAQAFYNKVAVLEAKTLQKKIATEQLISNQQETSPINISKINWNKLTCGHLTDGYTALPNDPSESF
jgi:hypothetical protein